MLWSTCFTINGVPMSEAQQNIKVTSKFWSSTNPGPLDVDFVESSPNHITGVIGLRFDSDDEPDLPAIKPCDSGCHQRTLFVDSSMPQSK